LAGKARRPGRPAGFFIQAAIEREGAKRTLSPSHCGDRSILSLPDFVSNVGTIEPAESAASIGTHARAAVVRMTALWPPRSDVSNVENGAVNGSKPRTISARAHSLLTIMFARAVVFLPKTGFAADPLCARRAILRPIASGPVTTPCDMTWFSRRHPLGKRSPRPAAAYHRRFLAGVSTCDSVARSPGRARPIGPSRDSSHHWRP